MFIGFYRLDNKEYFDIYYKNSLGYEEWHKNTFNPNVEDITILDFKIGGKDYQERKENLKELAINWQLYFAGLEWSYGELMAIGNYFYENGKKYGLLKEFKENCIC